MNLRAAAMNFNIQALKTHGIRLSMSSTESHGHSSSQTLHDSGITEQAEQLSRDDNIVGVTVRLSKEKLEQYIADKFNGDSSRLSELSNLARGPVGETCLHICFLVCEPAHIQFAKWLLSLDPALISTVYEKPEYHGENVLHMAIVGVAKGKLGLRDLEWLVRLHPALVKGKADGDFFQRPREKGKVTCAWGETPLNFAVALNQPEVVRFLVRRAGADMLDTDSEGNTCMHIAVRHNRAEMIDLLDSLWQETQGRLAGPHPGRPTVSDAIVQTMPLYKSHSVYQPSLRLADVPNHEKHVPLVYAAELGDLDLFEAIWKRHRHPVWSFAHVTCWEYPLEHVDDVCYVAADEEGRRHGLPPGAGRGRTALQLMTDEGSDSQARLVEKCQVLRKVLEQKWYKYAKAKFMYRLWSSLVYLAVFSGAVMLRGQSGGRDEYSRAGALSQYGLGHFDYCSVGVMGELSLPALAMRVLAASGVDARSAMCRLGIVLEVVVFLGAVFKLASTVLEMRAVGWTYFWKARGATRLERAASLTFGGLICLAAVFEARGDAHASQVAVSVASVAGYSYMLWFLYGFRLTGPFVVMLFRMVSADLLRFLSIAGVLLLGFSQAFFVHKGLSGFAAFFGSFSVVLTSLLGGDAPDLTKQQDGNIVVSSNPFVGPYSVIHSSVLALAFLVLGNIVLLNLLVAMMGDTYRNVSESADMQWHLERARIIQQIEARMSASERLSEANKYYKKGSFNILWEEEATAEFRSYKQRTEGLVTAPPCSDSGAGALLTAASASHTWVENASVSSAVGNVTVTETVGPVGAAAHLVAEGTTTSAARRRRAGSRAGR